MTDPAVVYAHRTEVCVKTRVWLDHISRLRAFKPAVPQYNDEKMLFVLLCGRSRSTASGRCISACVNPAYPCRDTGNNSNAIFFLEVLLPKAYTIMFFSQWYPLDLILWGGAAQKRRGAKKIPTVALKAQKKKKVLYEVSHGRGSHSAANQRQRQHCATLAARKPTPGRWALFPLNAGSCCWLVVADW